MHWLFLLLALGALILAFSTTHMWLLLSCLVAALLLMLGWARGWYLSRMGDGQDTGQIIDPVELHRLRTLAQARQVGDQDPQS
ncbi:MAG TPA: hypothetical protein VGC74_17040 [Stenotrophomonas sp.]|jgi:hypothetical protein